MRQRPNLNKTIRCTIGMMFLSLGLHAQELAPAVNRKPAFAGTFYNGTKQALESQLQKLFAGAAPKEVDGTIRCLIVPHAGYEYSGHVSASGYKSIPPESEYDNVFIIASSHREQFEGVSVYSPGNYTTPLGEARVNRQIANDLIHKSNKITYLPKAHDREHSIEVQVPMIQYYFKDTPPIIPIVIGNSSVATARDLAAVLMPYFTPDNLFIISSDFSHYPRYADAIRIDRNTGNAILTNDPEQFYNTLRTNSSDPAKNLATPCCGWSSVLSLLYMSEKDKQLTMTPIIYQNSGDAAIGDKERVVGYWAIAGHEIIEDPLVLNLHDKKVLLTLSRQTLESYLETGTIPAVNTVDMSAILREPAGAFVSLYKHGELRGRIGNFHPEAPLYEVVQSMTIAAATRDNRFYPVDYGELENIALEISVLTPLRKIKSVDEIELGRHGITIKKDGKSGTLLPQVAASNGWSREEFLGHCARDKAQIGWEGWRNADLFVFEAIVFRESHQE